MKAVATVSQAGRGSGPEGGVSAEDAAEPPSLRAEQLRRELFGDDWTVDEVAHVLGVDRSTVLRYLRDNVIFGYQLGREWRIPEQEVREYRRRLVDERRFEVERSAADLAVDKKIKELNARYNAQKYIKGVCEGCLFPVVMKYFESQTQYGNSETGYAGKCDRCREEILITSKEVRVDPPKMQAPDHGFGDEDEIPF